MNQRVRQRAKELRNQLDTLFCGIKGPPGITLSVARGLDDHQYSRLKELAKLQRHHGHWSDVTEDEMERYHDCWAFMDSSAVRFYLPAFIAKHLNEIIDDPNDRNIEPNWFPPECITLGSEKLSSLSPEESAFVTEYLYFVEESIANEFARKLFRPTRAAWERIQGTKSNQPNSVDHDCSLE